MNSPQETDDRAVGELARAVPRHRVKAEFEAEGTRMERPCGLKDVGDLGQGRR